MFEWFEPTRAGETHAPDFHVPYFKHGHPPCEQGRLARPDGSHGLTRTH